MSSLKKRLFISLHASVMVTFASETANKQIRVIRMHVRGVLKASVFTADVI